MNFRVLKSGYLLIIFILFPIYLIGFNINIEGVDSVKYHPPIQGGIKVSGSFAELRSNHFHSGIDLSTSGVIGKSIYSISDGYISRVYCSSGGYGKALYITHPNGITSVYGHLDHFSSKIDSIVYAKQRELESFKVDFSLTPDICPVECGEVVAFSGNSGSSGGPHLHFEVRDSGSEAPMSPLSYVTIEPDRLSPDIKGVYVIALDDTSFVDGADRYYRAECVKIKDGEFNIKGGLDLRGYGNIGIGFEVIDRFSGSLSKCGVKSAALLERGDTLFSFDIDRFLFSDSRYINAHTLYEERIARRKGVHRMHRLVGNRLPIYGNSIDDGVLTVKKGDASRELTLSMVDESGNSSRINFKLKPRPRISKTVAEAENIIEYNRPYSYREDGLSLNFEEGSLYQNIDFVCKTLPKETNYSKIYSIHSDDTPIHKRVDIEIEIKDTPESVRDKLIITQRNSAGSFWSAGGEYQEIDGRGVLKGSIRAFGIYGVEVDTIAPKIYSVSIANGIFKNRDYFKFKMSDALSGIDTYRVEVDGRWVLADFDGKSRTVTVDTKRAGMIKGTKYNISIEVVDYKGNIAKYETVAVR